MQDRPSIEEGLLGPAVGGTAQHVLADHDHQHGDQLSERGQKRHEQERVPVEALYPEHRQADPDHLGEEGRIERPHAAQPLGQPGRDPPVHAHYLVAGLRRVPHPMLFDPRVWLGLQQADPVAERAVVPVQVLLQFDHLVSTPPEK